MLIWVGHEVFCVTVVTKANQLGMLLGKASGEFELSGSIEGQMTLILLGWQSWPLDHHPCKRRAGAVGREMRYRQRWKTLLVLAIRRKFGESNALKSDSLVHSEQHQNQLRTRCVAPGAARDTWPSSLKQAWLHKCISSVLSSLALAEQSPGHSGATCLVHDRD